MPTRPSAGIGVVEVQKLEVLFFAFLRCADEPSMGIGVVKVQNQQDGLSQNLQTIVGHFELFDAQKRFGEVIRGQ